MSSVPKKRKKRKDYQDKSFNNPFYKNKKNKKGRRESKSKKSIFLTFVILLILAFAFWFFYISDTFKIKNIEINGLERTAEKQVLNNVSEFTNQTRLFLKQDNLFLLNSNNLAENLKHEFNFAEVNVSKELSNKLIVSITERKYEAIFLENGDYYYIDNEGYLIDKINKLDKVNPRKYAIINNESNNTIEQEKKVGIQLKYIKFINNFFKELKQGSNDIIIEKFIVKNRNSGLSAQVIGGPVLYLNIDDEASAQVRNLIALKENQSNKDFFNRSYIDLRYGDRLFLE